MRQRLEPFFILSAHRPKFTETENAHRTDSLIHFAKTDGASQVRQVRGVYRGVPEVSVLAFGLDEEQAIGLGYAFDQECILAVCPDRTARLIYTDGSGRDEYIGKFRNVSEQEAKSLDAYTFDGELYWAVV